MTKKKYHAQAAPPPITFDDCLWGGYMRKYHRWAKKLGYTASASAEEFYGFTSADVDIVYIHKHGEGEGAWFRLKDGRVFDSLANPDDPDPAFYNSKSH